MPTLASALPRAEAIFLSSSGERVAIKMLQHQYQSLHSKRKLRGRDWLQCATASPRTNAAMSALFRVVNNYVGTKNGARELTMAGWERAPRAIIHDIKGAETSASAAQLNLVVFLPAQMRYVRQLLQKPGEGGHCLSAHTLRWSRRGHDP